jgi:YVTN family beta-propeller protein
MLDTDPNTNRIFTESQCGNLNDPVQGLDGATNTLRWGPAGSGGVASGLKVNPATQKVYAVAGGPNQTRVFTEDLAYVHDLPGVSIVAVNPLTNLLYFDSGPDLQVFDGSSDCYLTTIAGAAGSAAVNTGLDRIYVADSTNDVVKTIDGSTNTVIDSFSLGANIAPYNIGVDSAKNLLYVTGGLADGTTKLFVVADQSGPMITQPRIPGGEALPAVNLGIPPSQQRVDNGGSSANAGQSLRVVTALFPSPATPALEGDDSCRDLLFATARPAGTGQFLEALSPDLVDVLAVNRLV